MKIVNQVDFILNGKGCTFIQRNKNADVIYVEGGRNITLKDFKATHTEPNGPLGCTGSVVQVYNNQDMLIQDCKLNGCGIIGLMAYNSKNLNLKNNYIYNNSQYGVLFDKESSLDIRNNTFEDNGETGNAHVFRALNSFLSQVEEIGCETKADDVIMSDYTFQ